MKIAEVRIQNLRGYHDEIVALNDYTCLIGANGVGKSTILCALCIFFRDTEHSATNLHALQAEDFHCMETATPVTITVTFVDLSPEAQDDFKEYYRQGKLIVSAVATYDPATKTAEVKQYGQRMVMRLFRPYFAADNDGKPVTYLREKYDEIRKSCQDLPEAKTKAQMTDALRQHENAHPELCELVTSSDQFYGFSSGVNRLAKYVQWVYVPAVKDATKEQTETKNTALGKLVARTVRSKIDFSEEIAAIHAEAAERYEKLIQGNQASLQGISATLEERLKDWAHPGARVKLQWRGTPERAIKVDEPLAQLVAGEGRFDGDLSRFGHGLQRCYILALLQELSGNTDDTGPKLILGCEEPELHQHPPQARHLADVLFRLSKRNSQVIVSTHSPYFVSGERFADVRLIRKDVGTHRASVSHVTMEALAATIAHAKQEKPTIADALALKMQQALLPSLNELFFTRVVVLVEGLEDIAYITAYFNLLDLWEEFRRQGCHLVSADSKSHMLQPLAIAKHLKIPAFVVFDSDGDKPDKSGSKTKHEKDNMALLRLRGYETQSPFPADTFWAPDMAMWNSDIGTVVHADLGAGLPPILEKVRTKFGNVGGLDKTAMFISGVLAEAWQASLRSSNLEKLCLSILEFARKPFAVAKTTGGTVGADGQAALTQTAPRSAGPAPRPAS